MSKTIEFTEEERREFEIAQERSRQNDLPGTLAILEKLVLKRPDSAVLSATYANTLKEAGEIDAAICYFRRAVNLSPKSEKYSLGLFHCLWRQGNHEQALDETKRFMSLSDSAEYREIVEDINKNWPNIRLVKK